MTSERRADGCYQAGSGRKVEPEKPRTLNLGKSWGKGLFVGHGIWGGADDKGGVRVCPRENLGGRHGIKKEG